MPNPTTQSFEATVRGQLIIAGDNGYDLHHPKLEAALREQTQIIVAANQAVIDQKILDELIALLPTDKDGAPLPPQLIRAVAGTTENRIVDRIVVLTKKEARDTNEPTN